MEAFEKHLKGFFYLKGAKNEVFSSQKSIPSLTHITIVYEEI